MKFCVDVGTDDLITCAKLGEDRLRGLGRFSIDLRSKSYNNTQLVC